MIEIVISNGDRAEAATPEDAVYAARTMIREARVLRDRPGIWGATFTATFSVEGEHVRTVSEEALA